MKKKNFYCNNISKLLFLLVGIQMIMLDASYSMITGPLREPLWGYDYQNRRMSKREQQYNVLNNKLEKKKTALEDERKKGTAMDQIVVAGLEKEIDDLTEQIGTLWGTGRSIPGTLIGRGLAGQYEWDTLEDTHVTSIGDGIKQGLMIRTSKAIGDTLGTRIAGAVDSVLGGMMDFLLSKTVGAGKMFYEFIFYNGYEAFTPEQLDQLAQLVKVTLDDIEKMLREGIKESLRSYDMTSRKFDFSHAADVKKDSVGKNEQGIIEGLDDTASVGVDSFQNSKIACPLCVQSYQGMQQTRDLRCGHRFHSSCIAEWMRCDRTKSCPVCQYRQCDNAWAVLIAGYVDQFCRVIDEFEKNKEYYDKNSMERYYADQIQDRLYSLVAMLENSASLNELDEKLQSIKNIFSSLKRNIESLFKQLGTLVKPKSYSLGKENLNNNFYGGYNNQFGSGYGRGGYGGYKRTDGLMNDPFPQSYSGGGAGIF